jgi:membrane associated rhomboid family serine protease
MHQASVGFHCPECSKGGRQRVYTARTLMTQRPYVTLVLIAINAVVFVLDLSSSGGGMGSVGAVGDDLALDAINVAQGDWWRPVTAGFVHAGLVHIGFNMFLLYQLGLLLEAAVGRVAYLALYSVALVGGSFLVLILDPESSTVGASGAVFGLMGAAFVALRSRGINPFDTSIGPLIVINLVITFVARDEISVGGHVGGLVAGAAGGWLLYDAAPRLGQGARGRAIAVAVVAVASVALYVGCLGVAESQCPHAEDPVALATGTACSSNPPGG